MLTKVHSVFHSRTMAKGRKKIKREMNRAFRRATKKDPYAIDKKNLSWEMY